MSFIELPTEIEQQHAQDCQEALENLGAVAVSYFDGGDDPLLEPLPGTMPLWKKVKIVGLFEENISMTSISEQLKPLFPNVTFSHQLLEDQDWTRTWLEHFQPMQFGQRLWIMPCDHPHPPEMSEAAVILRLDPGLAFGTGTHPTTALCLSWLAEQSAAAPKVIDYGCGSGILGIAALLLGSQQVYAVDYDPQALTATQDNAQRNQIPAENIRSVLPDQIPLPQVDLILANILANPLIELAEKLSGYCVAGGKIILSGLLATQADSVIRAYLPWFTFEPIKTQEDWVLLVGTRKI